MVKITSLFLSLLLSVYSFRLNGLQTVQGVLDDAGLPYACAARGIANAIRNIEAKYEKYPGGGAYEKKTFADDTGDDFVTEPENIINAQTWIMTELSFESTKTYADPFNDVDIDLVLVGGGLKYTIPGFWDGENIWKVRFVCPSEGVWFYKTVCTDAENTGLDGRTGRVNCTEYDGELEIYRHGFLSAGSGKKYLTYDDGTPFFYLGDTHWDLGLETQAMVETITAKRVEQGFTVWQSEPRGAAFNLTDGVTREDIDGFAAFDEKFKTIADAGLVHTNAQFFFPSDMQNLINNYGGFKNGEVCESVKVYLEKLSRLWAARYSAFPVIWTLGQEADNDFYADGSEWLEWTPENNPYKLVAEYIAKYDAYSQPLTAHQENVSCTAAYGNGNGLDEKLTVYKNSAPSAFRNVEAHRLYAAQWSPALTDKSDCSAEKDYWYNSQGKPVINYEGRYCYLWTKNFGSRMQGWAAYLSGMYGYGWGAHDTWSYLNTYDEENDSSDGVDTVTSAEKINATWEDALEYPSSYQMGYMKRFFEGLKWWELIPRFDNCLYFDRTAGVYAYAASNADNSEMVIYFYNFADESIGAKPNSNIFSASLTGRIGSLEPSAEYGCKWFDPSTGEFSQESRFTSTPFGTYSIGKRVFNGETVTRDMVFYMYKLS